MLPIEKLNLTRNMQTNFNELGPLSSVFQKMIRGRGDGKFALGGFFYWVVRIRQGVILTTQNFFKAKNNLL